jgi:phospholipid transport system substrate-binding protein
VSAPIRALNDALLSVMRQGKSASFDARAAALGPVIDRAFDLDAILRASVGPDYAALPADQKSALVAAFRAYTIASYVHSFDSFNGQRFDLRSDTRQAPNGDQVVGTRITPTNGDSHELDYVLHDQGGTWRVVDVLADGSISRVAVQRSDFRRLLAQGGADALIGSLQAKTRDLATP